MHVYFALEQKVVNLRMVSESVTGVFVHNVWPKTLNCGLETKDALPLTPIRDKDAFFLLSHDQCYVGFFPLAPF